MNMLETLRCRTLRNAPQYGVPPEYGFFKSPIIKDSALLRSAQSARLACPEPIEGKYAEFVATQTGRQIRILRHSLMGLKPVWAQPQFHFQRHLQVHGRLHFLSDHLFQCVHLLL